MGPWSIILFEDIVCHAYFFFFFFRTPTTFQNFRVVYLKITINIIF